MGRGMTIGGIRVIGCHMCEYEMFPATWNTPAEYCENYTEDGKDFCEDHDPDRGEPDWDERRKERLIDCN